MVLYTICRYIWALTLSLEREPVVAPLLACQPPLLHLAEDPARMAALLRTYAPEVRFHPVCDRACFTCVDGLNGFVFQDEVYYPCPIDWYLRNCELYWDAKTGFNFTSHPRVLARLENFDSLAVRYVWKVSHPDVCTKRS
jgi:hypothetical protein